MKNAKVISVCSQKGGVSKTSTTIEIATILSQRNFDVLVIDLDQQCSLSKNVGGDLSKNSIYDIFHAECSLEDAIQHLELFGFDLITSSESLSRVDREFVDLDDVFLLSDVCNLVKEKYDYIFVDNAPSRNILLNMSYIASDYVIIPTECDESSLDGAVTTREDILKIVNGRRHDSHARILGYVLNRSEQTIMCSIALDTLREQIAPNTPGQPFIYEIRKSVKVSEVKSLHSAVSIEYKNEKIANDYNGLVDVILESIKKGA